MYDNPPAAVAFADGMAVERDLLALAARDFDEFYEEVFMKCAEYGEVEDIAVLDNISDHMIGNVYVKFYNEDDADRAMKALHGKFYGGRPIMCEFSPVTNFKEARCRQYSEGSCDRGGYCNFMHTKHVSKKFKKELWKQMYEMFPEYKKQKEDREEEMEG